MNDKKEKSEWNQEEDITSRSQEIERMVSGFQKQILEQVHEIDE